ncbi:MAG: hypothetical protein AB7P12_14000 [Alphaproteobacteria bacterium]
MKMTKRIGLRRRHLPGFIWLGALAGLAGGFAEIAWIYVYAELAGLDAGKVARGISTAVGMGASDAPTLYGIAIHMALAIALGIALTFMLRPALRRLPGDGAIYAAAFVVLTGVWIINFLVVLPRLSPAFVHLVPYQVSLLSKLLFALAAALVFRSTHIISLARK